MLQRLQLLELCPAVSQKWCLSVKNKPTGKEKLCKSHFIQRRKKKRLSGFYFPEASGMENPWAIWGPCKIITAQRIQQHKIWKATPWGLCFEKTKGTEQPEKVKMRAFGTGMAWQDLDLPSATSFIQCVLKLRSSRGKTFEIFLSCLSCQLWEVCWCCFYLDHYFLLIPDVTAHPSSSELTTCSVNLLVMILSLKIWKCAFA